MQLWTKNVNLYGTLLCHISKVLRYGPCVTRRSHSFTCHPHPYLPLLLSHKVSSPFGWYSLRLPMKGWPRWVDLDSWLRTAINVPHRQLNPDTVTHPSTNPAQRRLTSLIETDVLPLCQTATIWWFLMHDFFSTVNGCVTWTVWRCVSNEKELGSVDEAHETMVWSLSWHPLGHILVSGSNDHTTWVEYTTYDTDVFVGVMFSRYVCVLVLTKTWWFVADGKVKRMMTRLLWCGSVMIGRDENFLLATEFWAEPRNLLSFCGNEPSHGIYAFPQNLPNFWKYTPKCMLF